MRRAACAVAVCLVLGWVSTNAGAADLVFTTTVAKETGNNTSAANSFLAQTNGNAGAGNVSKMPVRQLLYAGSTTKIYAHFMPWFGGTNHMNVGYRSDDAAQVKRQVADMMSRGIDGAIVDWYGPDFARENNTTLLLMKEAELHAGRFEFAVTEDGGALKKCANTAGCDVTQRLIDDLNYAARTYFISPAYMRHNGRPVLFFFGVNAYNIDWSRVRAGAEGEPLFIHRNSGGFSHAQTDGSYAWLAPQQKATYTEGYMSLGYLDNFYTTAQKYPWLAPFGSGFLGFDDSLAAWGSNRYIGQYCGLTWLESMARAGLFYSQENQLPFLQLVTWNDYEEGSALEVGVENCLSVSATLSGTTLSWSLVGAGSERTVDHFNVFVSVDGVNLAKLTPLNVNTRSLDLAKFDLAAGTYQLYVQAYGKASIRNKLSAAVTYTVAAAAPPEPEPEPAPTSPAPLAVVASPTSATVKRGSAASYSLSITGGAGEVTLSCSGLPAKSTCTFLPAKVTPGSGTASSTMTVQTSGPGITLTLMGGSGAALMAGSLLGFPLLGAVFVRLGRRRALLLALLAGTLLVVSQSACGGLAQASASKKSPLSNGGTPTGSYTITITGSAGTEQKTTSVTLIVQ